MSTLKKAMQQASGKPERTNIDVSPPPSTLTVSTRKQPAGTRLLGAHYLPQVHQAMRLLQADERTNGKTIKQLLGEAINDLCEKYGKPRPFTEID